MYTLRWYTDAIDGVLGQFPTVDLLDDSLSKNVGDILLNGYIALTNRDESLYCRSCGVLLTLDGKCSNVVFPLEDPPLWFRRLKKKVEETTK